MLRVLATYQPSDLPRLSLDPEIALQLGQVPGISAEGRYAIQWDRRREYTASDYGWIGEDAGGIWMTRHPISAVATYPELAPILGRWESGQRELTPADYDTLAARTWDALACMQSAAQRRDFGERK